MLRSTLAGSRRFASRPLGRPMIESQDSPLAVHPASVRSPAGTATDLRADDLRPAPNLEIRQQRERAFHDVWASEVDPHELDPIRRAFCPTTPETTFALRAIGDVHGRRLLDLGCGPGETSTWFALQGARVDAVDISPGMIELTRGLSARLGVSELVHCRVSPGESLPYPDASFDRVFGHDCLHHMEFDRALDEVKRVLRPGGLAVFAEPLGHNPVINYFRDKSPRTRTPDEVPLRFSDFERMRKRFRSVRHREYQFATLALFLWFFLVEHSDPNQVRYWKKIIV